MKKIIPILILLAVGVVGYLYFGPKKEGPSPPNESGSTSARTHAPGLGGRRHVDPSGSETGSGLRP